MDNEALRLALTKIITELDLVKVVVAKLVVLHRPVWISLGSLGDTPATRKAGRYPSTKLVPVNRFIGTRPTKKANKS